MRVLLESTSKMGELAEAIGRANGLVTGLDVGDPIEGRMVVDVTCNATDEAHAELLEATVNAIEGAEVHARSDRTFQIGRAHV